MQKELYGYLSYDTACEISSVHVKVFEFKCDICGVLFSRKEHLKQHMNFVHKDEDIGVQCDICKREKPFSPGNIKDHKKRCAKKSKANSGSVERVQANWSALYCFSNNHIFIYLGSHFEANDR